jgi:hypothetical protein
MSGPLEYIATLQALQSPNLLSTASADSIGVELSALAAGAPVSTVWAANIALYVPFILRAPSTAVKLWAMNGTVVSGNIDMGIYLPDGTKKVTMGSTAQAGTSAIQVFDIADTSLAAGKYYLGVALDNSTGTLSQWTVSTTHALGVLLQAATFPLPSPAVFSTSGTTKIPLVGLSQIVTF